MLSNATSDPVCSKCKGTSSLIWQRDQKGEIICLDCHAAEKAASKSFLSLSNAISDSSTSNGKQGSPHKGTSRTSQHTSSSSSTGSLVEISSSGITTRRSTRSHERARARQQLEQEQAKADNYIAEETGDGSIGEEKDKKLLASDCSKAVAQPGSPPGSGRDEGGVVSQTSLAAPASPCSSSSSRHSLRQGQPVQAAESQPFILTSWTIEHQGVTYEVGDVVSLLDQDGGVYYAVLRGFMCDQYANKFTVLTWLLPKVPNPTHFDPALFILGPEEDRPRSMDQINFVCHSPQSRHFQHSYSHNLHMADLWLSSIASSSSS